MNRKWIVCSAAAVLTLAAALAWAVAKPHAGQAAPLVQPSLAASMPPGASLILEAKDLSSLLAEWNSSPEKRQWLKSDNFEVFSRSRVLLRLAEAQQQFAAAGGVPPDMAFLSQAAGKESILGIYDIGKLEILYITRLPSAGAMQSALYQARAKFEPRTAAGAPFFIHTDKESGRVVAFAIAGDNLLLATREDLLARALELLPGGPNPKAAAPNVTGEDWYSQSISSAGEPGDLRMVLNMEKIVDAPQFRSYWIQHNVPEMRQYSAAISDLYRSGSVYREERVLLRKSASPSPAKPDPATAAKPEDSNKSVPAVRPTPTPEGMQAVADLLRLVPDDAGVYRASANPAAVPDDDEVLALLQEKILSPQPTPAFAQNLAPGVNLTGGEVGASADLETRIDQPPPDRPASPNDSDKEGLTALRHALESANVQAMLSLESTHAVAESSFIEIHSAVVLAAASDWDANSVYAALAAAVNHSTTTQHLGASWKKAGKAPDDYSELDGLLPLRVAFRGKLLIASGDAETIAAILARLKTHSSASPASYAAGFHHAAERKNFIRLTSVLDRVFSPDSYPGGAVTSSYDPGGDSPLDSSTIPTNWRTTPGAPQPGDEPAFFSGNIASLSRVLSALDSESIVIRDSPAKTFETVIYRWK
jgi:hypothetical protein